MSWVFAVYQVTLSQLSLGLPLSWISACFYGFLDPCQGHWECHGFTLKKNGFIVQSWILIRNYDFYFFMWDKTAGTLKQQKLFLHGPKWVYMAQNLTSSAH